jgi:hypothetical protein
MKKFLYIARFPALAVLLLCLSALAPAQAQNVVYQDDITTLKVKQQPGDVYVWELYNDSTVDFAVVPGACPTSLADFVGGNIGSSVQVEWKEPGIYFYKVTGMNASGCTMNIAIGKVKVKPAIPWAELTLSPVEICEGESAELRVTFYGRAPWDMKLQATDLLTGKSVIQNYTGIPKASNPFLITVNPKADTEYTVIEVSNKYGATTVASNSVTLTVHPLPKNTAIYVKP